MRGWHVSDNEDCPVRRRGAACCWLDVGHTIAALFPPKEYGGSDDERTDGDKWDESIEDV